MAGVEQRVVEESHDAFLADLEGTGIAAVPKDTSTKERIFARPILTHDLTVNEEPYTEARQDPNLGNPGCP